MKKIILVLSLLILTAAPLVAQTYPRSTTLSASITSQQTTFVLASGTGVEANGALWIDAEFMPIVSCAVAACTTVNVNRTNGKPQPHASSTVVTVVSAAAKPNIMLAHSGAYRVGQCSTSTSSTPATALANFQFLPIFDVDTGDVFMCRRNGTGGAWVWNRLNVQAYNGELGSVWTAWP